MNYLNWGSPGFEYPVTESKSLHIYIRSFKSKLDHFGFKELTKQGWQPGKHLPGKDRQHGLINPLTNKGFNVERMYEITSEQISNYPMGKYPENDEHYPDQLRRPGLGSHPMDLDGNDPGFDCTVRSDQSRIHFPGLY